MDVRFIVHYKIPYDVLQVLFLQIHVISRVDQGKLRETDDKTLRFPLSAHLLKY